MADRLTVDELLRSLCEHVYYGAPNNITMKYPAIKYSLARPNNTFANNKIYKQTRTYTVTVIDKDVESPIAEKMMLMPEFRFDRPYAADGLNHFVFSITI